MLAADEAERRGDAAAALGIMRSMSIGPDGRPFWRPRRLERLRQVAEAGPRLPAWAVSRWLLEQALQETGHGTRRRVQRALRVAVDLRGGATALPGADQHDAMCKVMDHDWVYRQLRLYDAGGLDHFLRHFADRTLVARADRIAEWASAPMGGYRLLGGSRSVLTWEDLASDERVELMNIGADSLVEDGDCVIGRVVPIEDGAMFETAPLPVPEEVAAAAASSPLAWVEALREGVAVYGVAPRRGQVLLREEIIVEGLHDYRLLTDVPKVLERMPWRGGAA